MGRLLAMKKKLSAGFALVNLVLMLGCFVGTSQAAMIKVALDDSFQSDGSLQFFSGRMLNADDLTREQEYYDPNQRFLTGSDGDILMAFESGEFREPYITFYLWEGGSPPEAPSDPDLPYAGDFFWLDSATTWHGNLWIPQLGGVYEVSGTYSVSVPEPSTMLLFSTGLAGFGLLRKRLKS